MVTTTEKSSAMAVERTKPTIFVPQEVWDAFDRLPRWQDKHAAIAAAMWLYARLPAEAQYKALQAVEQLSSGSDDPLRGFEADLAGLDKLAPGPPAEPDSGRPPAAKSRGRGRPRK